MTREMMGELTPTGDEGSRKFTLSFSSEIPYKRAFGEEILDHAPGAVNLKRLENMGVVLFNHNRDNVIGKINRVWTEKKRGMAEIEFDTDEFSETIYQKVRSGTLKGVSVGYKVNTFEPVLEGRKSKDMRFDGPSYVARRWEPYEVSIVSVPADPTVGVGRSEADMDLPEIDDGLYETYMRQYQYNLNLARGML